MSRVKNAPIEEPNEDNVDLRERLYDDGQIGKIAAISTAVDLVTTLNGILLDIDCHIFQSSFCVPEPDLLAPDFYERYVRPWLNRHPVLHKAQVRFSGTGLHVLLMLDKPIELRDGND